MAEEILVASIIEDGVLLFEDSEIGKLVDEFIRRDYPFQTEYGLRFVKAAALDKKKRSRGVVDSIFKRPTIGLLKAYGPNKRNPNPVHLFCNNDKDHTSQEHEFIALIAYLLPKNSEGMVYKRSHLHAVHGEKTPTKLLSAPEENLEKDDITKTPFNFKNGGLILTDWSACIKTNGKRIIVGITGDKGAKYWTKMRAPLEAEPDLKPVLGEFAIENIGVNMVFVPMDELEDPTSA